MFDEHETFKIYGTPDKMRSKIMSGNRLNTNSHLKWLLGCIQSGVKVTDQEMTAHFYTQRSEYISQTTVHTYTALVLLVRFGELPQKDNVPNNADNSPKMKEWALFPGFLEELVSNLARTHIKLDITLGNPLEWVATPVVPQVEQEPVWLSHLQLLETSVRAQLRILQLEQYIWQSEIVLRQHVREFQIREMEFAKRERYFQWEIQRREAMRFYTDQHEKERLEKEEIEQREKEETARRETEKLEKEEQIKRYFVPNWAASWNNEEEMDYTPVTFKKPVCI